MGRVPAIGIVVMIMGLVREREITGGRVTLDPTTNSQYSAVHATLLTTTHR